MTEEERKSYVRVLDQKSMRLKVLIEDLFEVSKASSGTVSPVSYTHLSGPFWYM